MRKFLILPVLVGVDDIPFESVPEPASLTVFGLGAVAAIRRRKATSRRA